MGQNPTVASFRKRLFSRGYRDISIMLCRDVDSAFPVYFVVCKEPVFNSTICGFLSEIQMTNVSCRKLSGKK